MFFYVLNELGAGVFFHAEYDREKEHLQLTFYEQKPKPKPGVFLTEHLHSGQGVRLPDFGTCKSWEADVSGLSYGALLEDEVGMHGIQLKLKMKNGSHIIEKRKLAQDQEFEIVFTPEDPDDLPN